MVACGIPVAYIVPCKKSFTKSIMKLICGNSPVSIYLLKTNNRGTRTRCEICSKLTIKTLFWCIVLVSLLLTLNIFHTLFYCFYC